MTNAAEAGEKASVRALQAWQCLIDNASHRQIAQYDDLRELMEYTDNRPLSSILGCIMYYREQDGLLPLTLIVVNRTGVPGEGFTAEQLQGYHQRREDVFNYAWYRMVPPTMTEFRDAYVQGRQGSA